MSNVFQEKMLSEERDEARNELLHDILIKCGFLIDFMKREQERNAESSEKLQAQIERMAYVCRKINKILK